MEFIEYLNQIEEQYNELEQKLSTDEVLQDQNKLRELTKKYHYLQKVVDKIRYYKQVHSNLQEARRILKEENEPDMLEIASEEKNKGDKELKELEQQIKILLLPADPRDQANIIIEIRAGTGGEEAALFAAGLFKMYCRFAESMRWKVEVLSTNTTDLGGFKEIIFSVSGKKVYASMKYESGVHRVQRIPETEGGGRIHTSAVTVAVLPEPREVEVEIRSEDLRIDVFRASGSGGQHVNTTDSAVRITHNPTGIVVSCQDEKSQIKNRSKAMKVLKARLYDKQITEQQNRLAQERKSQVGSGDRSERIRTYNFPQNRVTDHRINLTLYKLDQILLGDIQELIDNLRLHYQTKLLEEEFNSIA